MKMTAATATLLKCQADEFYRLEDMWTGGLVQTFCFSAGCFVMFPPQISVLFHTMLTTCLNRNKPCRVFLPHWIGGDEPATRQSFSLLGFQNMGCTIRGTGHSQGAQQRGRVFLRVELRLFQVEFIQFERIGAFHVTQCSVVFPPCMKFRAKSAAKQSWGCSKP